MSNIKIYKPEQSWTVTSRELVDMWEESGFCELLPTDHNCMWMDNVGDILLYDHPRLQFLPNYWNIALFGNTQCTLPNCYTWIFWPRSPKLLEEVISKGIKDYNERKIISIFLGKTENPEQFQNRKQFDWSKNIEIFSMPVGENEPYPYTQREYLDKIKQSKFGLVLPGYGPKCNREIELMGLGTVPIFTPRCEIKYYNSLELNKHYLFANDPEEVKNVIENCSKDQWEYISNECKKWYEENCSRSGSFKTTIEIIERFKNI